MRSKASGGPNDHTSFTPAELTEACYDAAATAVVAYVLAAGYYDVFVNDGSDGGADTSKVFVKGWGDNPSPGALESTAMIYEAGGRAVAKLRGIGSHVIVGFVGSSLRRLVFGGDLDTRLLMWAAIEALAAYVEDNYEGDGAYGAMAEHDDEDAAIKVLKDHGLYVSYWFDRRNEDGDDGGGRDDEGGPLPDGDGGAHKVLELEEA